MSSYLVSTPAFEGPLDLLLQLVEKRQFDITTVSLALVTDQFVEHLRSGVGIDPEQLSEFVGVAAKLLLIKSVALLPRQTAPAASGPAEDPTDLTEKLREYERIKRGALGLRSREEAELRSYAHAAPADVRGWLETVRDDSERQLDLFGGSREAQPPGVLATALRRIASRKRPEPTRVAREKWSVADAVAWLAGKLRHGMALSFRSLVESFDRHRVVGAFLAILELHRQGQLRVSQSEAFGDIEIAPLSEAERRTEGDPAPEQVDHVLSGRLEAVAVEASG